ncbi:hypothetical protein M9H77_04978 [Catharanthus roseus]|uniref:Uncharacterized protein n=1 Tax=Catharanthus roseus TaxID=4058 RepID=A0ACC0CFP7_CATRO|nr:hypothetical protein M9H77_04978 [Catharanthus roseus]
MTNFFNFSLSKTFFPLHEQSRRITEIFRECFNRDYPVGGMFQMLFRRCEGLLLESSAPRSNEGGFHGLRRQEKYKQISKVAAKNRNEGRDDKGPGPIFFAIVNDICELGDAFAHDALIESFILTEMTMRRQGNLLITVRTDSEKEFCTLKAQKMEEHRQNGAPMPNDIELMYEIAWD